MPDNNPAVDPQTTPAAEAAPAPVAPETQTPENGDGKDNLKNLGAEKLVDMLLETRTEAKNRRLELKEVKGTLTEIQTKQAEADEDLLKQNNEFKTLYEQHKEKTSDYDSLKEFRDSYLADCQTKVDAGLEKLTEQQKKLFDLGASNKTPDEQLKFITELVGVAAPTVAPPTDNTQSSGRSAPQNPTPAGPVIPFANDKSPLGVAMRGLNSAANVKN